MTKLFLNLLRVVVLPGVLASIMPAGLAQAAIEPVLWCPVNMPAEGESGGWVLAEGADVRDLARAADGTLYCHATPSGTAARLFKSTDGGNSWVQTGGVHDEIARIATVRDDASTVYYTTHSTVYRSTDAGGTFTALPANPGGSGTNNVNITCIDIARRDTGNLVVVGTRDTDGAEYGGVFLLDEGNLPAGWVDTGIGNLDVFGVSFSPHSATDGQLLAVASDETDTFILARIGNEAWGATVGGTTVPGVAPVSAAVAFPDDYQALTEGASFFTALNTGSGGGDVYRVGLAANTLTATDLDIGSAVGLGSVDVASLAVAGNAAGASLLAGAAASTDIYASSNGGLSWGVCTRAPTGQSGTRVLMLPDFATRKEALAATCGTESALSRTVDGGSTWNQVSLIDTAIDAITDVAVSPGHVRDNTLFMITHDSGHSVQSLWRTTTDGAFWERLLSSSAPDVDELRKVALPDGYGPGNPAVFLTGTAGGGPVIWTSADNGQTFAAHAMPLAVDAWTAMDAGVFIAGYDGSNGLVYRFDGATFLPPAGASAGNQPLTSLAVSPKYEQDRTILAGNVTGQVYWSRDGGITFAALGQQLPTVMGTGEVSVTFDPAYSGAGPVYASSNAAVSAGSNKRVFRLVVGRDDTWQAINSTLPDGTTIRKVIVAPVGVLYAINTQAVDAAGQKGGMVRSLDPAFPLGQTFEAVTRGLAEGSTLDGLWVSDSRVWSVDTHSLRLMTFQDTMYRAVVLASPQHHARGVDTSNVSLSWAGPYGATQYQWQADYDGNFASIPDGFEGTTAASWARLPALQPNTTYYWRVRATRPVLSPWSAQWSFNTVLGRTVSALELLSPEAGATGVPRKPVFQWTPVAGANDYELLVSEDTLFTNPWIRKDGSQSLPATAWRSDISLEYNTTYFWKVRGRSKDSYSEWSAVGAFTTESAPPPPETPPPTPGTTGLETTEAEPTAPAADPEPDPPASPPERQPAAETVVELQLPPTSLTTVEIVVPEWIAYAVAALLSTMVLLLIVLVVFVGKMKRY